MLAETNVTEEAAKLGGTDPADAGVGFGVADLDSVPEVPEGDGRAGLGELCGTGVVEPDNAAGAPPTCLASTSWGMTIAPATTTAAPAAAMAAWRILRRRARFLICSKVPGRGSKGVTRSSSQVSMSSRGSSMGFPQHRAEPGPRVVQVGLDRALRPPEHLRDLPDREPGVIVQQERLAQAVGQRLDEGAHVHVLGRMMDALGGDGGAHGAQRAPLPADLAPMVPDQVRRNHVEIALRIV